MSHASDPKSKNDEKYVQKIINYFKKDKKGL